MEITAFCTLAERARTLKLQPGQVSVQALVILTEDPCQFRTAKFCEISAVGAGRNIHLVFAFFLWIENIFKSVVL